MFDIVLDVLTDIHTSPQNDITRFENYEATAHTILWNLRHSNKFNVTEDLYINIAINIDWLRKNAAVFMEKKYRVTPELYSVFQFQFVQSYEDKPSEWVVEKRYFKGNLSNVNIKTDERFCEIPGKRNYAYFCGLSYLTFPIVHPIEYLVTGEQRESSPKIEIAIQHRRGQKAKKKITPESTTQKTVTFKFQKRKHNIFLDEFSDLKDYHENRKASQIKKIVGDVKVIRRKKALD